MDYYIFITRSCNLQCKYCCFAGQLSTTDASGEKVLDPRKTAEFILDHIKANGYIDNKVFFYGGEPLLNRPWIEEFISLTEGQVEHIAQTNAMLLSSLPKELVAKFRHLEVSIDGTREIHDTYRGKGTFDRFVKNIRAIEDVFTGRMVARMTYTPDNPLADSVRLILDDIGLDEAYWMHEDSTVPPQAWIDTREEYVGHIDVLLDYWMEHLRQGVVKGIIPFKSIMSSLIDPPEQSCFRCGVGNYLLVIDTDGVCYPCDLMITDDKRYKIGDIESGVSEIVLPHNTAYESTCKSCDCFAACGGRCFQLSYNGDERFDIFCDRTKMLVGKLRDLQPEVEKLIASGVVSKQDIEIFTTMTEQIP